ncbi:MAG: adenine phosphoribosyltransferase [Chitinophagaceae bacterium]
MLIQSLIRNVPDYPIKGIMFKDITTLLKDAAGFKFTINEFVNRYRGMEIDKIAGIESRGFIFGAALAFELGIGFVPIRKKGKLPAETVGYDYELEYGTDRIEIHIDAIENGEKVLLVDDLIATGGTARAAIKLIEKMGGTIVESCFVVDLPFLGGSSGIKNSGHKIFSLCEYDSEHE